MRDLEVQRATLIALPTFGWLAVVVLAFRVWVALAFLEAEPAVPTRMVAYGYSSPSWVAGNRSLCARTPRGPDTPPEDGR